MRTWRVQNAKARFCALLEASLKEGPQMITKRGNEVAVLVSDEEWRRLQKVTGPTLKYLLLLDGSRAEMPLPPRGGLRRRPPSRFPIEVGIQNPLEDP